MNRFDPAHQTDDAFDDELAAALHEVDVPSGLRARLLDAVVDSEANSGVTNRPAADCHDSVRLSRRRWLSGGIAAAIGGLGLWGSYRWASRSLTEEEVWSEVSESLLSSDWKAFNRDVGPPYPFPRSMMRHSGWQARPTAIDNGTVAFNLTRAGVPAVLFVIRTGRSAKLPTLRQAKPMVQTGAAARDWNHTAIWRDESASYLYVLAYDGRREDFDRFFVGRTVPLA